METHRLHLGLAASQRVLRERQVVHASHARRLVGTFDEDLVGSGGPSGDAVSVSRSIATGPVRWNVKRMIWCYR